MTTITIDEAKAIELLEAAVQEKGADYVMQGACVYVEYPDAFSDVRGPKCLVGNVLHRAGVPVEVLAALDKQGDARIHSVGSMIVLKDADVVIDDAALKVLQAAQGAQDLRYEWGVALEYAKDANRAEDFDLTV